MTGRTGRTTGRTTGGALALVGVLLLALNLRPAAVTVGPVLTEVRAGLDLSAVEAGVLTSLPVLAFALFGAAAPWAERQLGLHRVALLALVAVGAGLVARAVVGSGVAFLVLSFLTLGGMAMANVLMPSLVRLHFPDRISTVTALYTTVLSCGPLAAFTLTVPVSDASGSWRVGLGVWALLAVAALVPWLALQRGAPRTGRDPDVTGSAPIGIRDVLGTRLGRAMVVFFGAQSMLAYAMFGWFATLWRDAGFSASAAGLLVGVVTLTGVPMSFLAPRAVARARRPVLVLAAVCACYPVGFLGLALAPVAAAVLWAVAVGAALATFPIVLVLIGLRSRTAGGTAALSSTTQSVGYLFSAVGPFAVGILHDATGGWTVPLLAMTAVVVPLFVSGAVAIASPVLEDVLPGLPSTHHAS